MTFDNYVSTFVTSIARRVFLDFITGCQLFVSEAEDENNASLTALYVDLPLLYKKITDQGTLNRTEIWVPLYLNDRCVVDGVLGDVISKVSKVSFCKFENGEYSLELTIDRNVSLSVPEIDLAQNDIHFLERMISHVEDQVKKYIEVQSV